MDKWHTVLATRAQSSGTDISQDEGSSLFLESFMAFIIGLPQASVQRAARALLSGLGERETQTFLFHLTNSGSFQGRFSSAQAGERKTCRGMIWAGRQQINQAELPALAQGREGRRGPSCSQLAADMLGEEAASQTGKGNMLLTQTTEKAED